MRKKFVFGLVAFVSALLFVFSGNTVYAETIPDRPPLNGIYDPHHYLSKEVSDKLSSMNWEYSRTEAKPQIAIAIVDSLDGNLETVANNVARNWQVGFSDTNYGMLVLISVKERKIRTEVSNNMGAIIPDSTAKELNDSIKDDFRNEDYSSGMLKYLSKVETIMSSSLLENKQNVKKEEYLSNELVEQIQKNEKEYNRKQGRIGAIIFGISILTFIFIGIRITKLQKEESEYLSGRRNILLRLAVLVLSLIIRLHALMIHLALLVLLVPMTLQVLGVVAIHGQAEDLMEGVHQAVGKNK